MFQDKISTRDDDDRQERMMDRFLVKNVYPLFVKAGIAKEIESVPMTDTRNKIGIDAVYTLATGKKVFIDNKTRGSFMNSKTHIFAAFELRTSDKEGKNRGPGWLIKASKDINEVKKIQGIQNVCPTNEPSPTDYIMLILPYTKNPYEKRQYKDINESDLKSLYILFVRLDELYEYLLSTFNLDMTTIYKTTLEFEKKFYEKTRYMTSDEIPAYLRACNEGFENGISKNGHKKAYIHSSINKGMKEDPINLLVNEDDLKKLSHTRWFMFDIYEGLHEDTPPEKIKALTQREDKN